MTVYGTCESSVAAAAAGKRESFVRSSCARPSPRGEIRDSFFACSRGFRQTKSNVHELESANSGIQSFILNKYEQTFSYECMCVRVRRKVSFFGSWKRQGTRGFVFKRGRMCVCVCVCVWYGEEKCGRR